MASLRIFSLGMVLFLIQASYASPLEDSSEEKVAKFPTVAQELYLHALDNFQTLGKNFAANAVNVSRSILKDESLLANNNPEVLEFKKNLTTFVEKYEAYKEPIKVWRALDIYWDTTHKYSKLPEEKVTPESTFVADILKKYKTKDVLDQFNKEFSTFMDYFEMKFEKNKMDFEKPMLDWYEKYKTTTDLEGRVNAFIYFVAMG